MRWEPQGTIYRIHLKIYMPLGHGRFIGLYDQKKKDYGPKKIGSTKNLNV